MDQRKLVLAAGMAALLVTSLMPATAGARERARFEPQDGRVRKAALQRLPSALAGSRKVNVIVELEGKPVAAYQGAAIAIGDTLSRQRKTELRREIVRRQAPARVAIGRAGGTVRASYTDVLNGVRIEARLRDLKGIGNLPGVKKVWRIPLHTRANENVVLETGAASTWGRTGLTGEGVKIAIIDSGINYYHKTFGGEGLAAWEADDGTNAGANFPTEKVIGGWDFVGDDYEGSEQPILQPDDDPLDCKAEDAGTVQHGTHVAGTAAGYGVTGDGETYDGPWTASAIEGAGLRIGPGTAPEASILAYRVFGCDGGTFLTIDAIDRAVRDGADVINMSLGSEFGNPGSVDAVASDNAALAGVVVVASAGNSSSSAYITGSPGSSTRTITVAAWDGVPRFPRAQVQLPGGVNLRAIHANDSDALPVSGGINVFQDDPGTTGDDETGEGYENLGCHDADYTYNGFQAGEIAVVSRGICDRTFRAVRGQANDAAAVIMVNTVDSLPPFEQKLPNVSIPFIGVASSAAGALDDADGASATIVANGTIANPSYGDLADFSSRGPGRIENLVKPDVSAPGVSVLSAWGATTAQGIAYSGTSMAAPATAGVAALVREAHPGWSPRAIKGAIVGTAAAGKVEDYTVRGAGAGLVRALPAVNTLVYATTGPGTSSITFGAQEGGNRPGSSTSIREVRTFTLVNGSSRPVSYALSNRFHGGSLGASVSLSNSVVTIPARSNRTVRVTLTMSESAAAALPATAPFHSQAYEIDGAGDPYAPVTNVAGIISARPLTDAPGAEALGIPWILVPRGISDLRPVPSTRSAWAPEEGGILSSTIRVRNDGIHKGWADLYSWGLRDTQETGGAMDLRAGGVQSLPAEVCGVEPDPDDRCLVFALSTWGAWDNAAAYEFDVNLFLDGDDEPDLLLIAIDDGLLGGYPGVTAVVAADPETFDVYAYYWAGVGMNASTITLPVLASEIGLSPEGDTSFRYSATGWVFYDDDYTGLWLDAMGTGMNEDGASPFAHYDAFAPVLSNGTFTNVNPGGSRTVPLAIDQERYDPLGKSHLGWMVVTMDDAAGEAQADLVPVGELPVLVD